MSAPRTFVSEDALTVVWMHHGGRLSAALRAERDATFGPPVELVEENPRPATPEPIPWMEVEREAISSAQVRELAGVTQRITLLKWRRRESDPFPAPVLTLDDGRLELWARADVTAWLERNRPAPAAR